MVREGTATAAGWSAGVPGGEKPFSCHVVAYQVAVEGPRSDSGLFGTGFDVKRAIGVGRAGVYRSSLMTLHPPRLA